MATPWLGKGDPFPPVESALRDPDGLLAAGDDLSPERLVDAYTRGIFPWFGGDDPVLWWSPDPRAVVVATRSARLAVAAPDHSLGGLSGHRRHRPSARHCRVCGAAGC